ncbi:unannotated protein [freshwater metagenome]|uniref:Unannotated protein n=1 Tax=freshwater metagenome TaxID=449393 RepID=A0A6J7LMZ8_9ZZZZ
MYSSITGVGSVADVGPPGSIESDAAACAGRTNRGRQVNVARVQVATLPNDRPIMASLYVGSPRTALRPNVREGDVWPVRQVPMDGRDGLATRKVVMSPTTTAEMVTQSHQ